MICLCWDKAREFLPLAAATARATLGMPDYDAYLTHLRARHPEAEPLTREGFFKARQTARFGGGALKCC